MSLSKREIILAIKLAADDRASHPAALGGAAR